MVSFIDAGETTDTDLDMSIDIRVNGRRNRQIILTKQCIIYSIAVLDCCQHHSGFIDVKGDRGQRVRGFSLSCDPHIRNDLARLTKTVRTRIRAVESQQRHVMAYIEIHWDVWVKEVSRVQVDWTQVCAPGRENCVVGRGGIELEAKEAVIGLAVEGKDLDIRQKDWIFKSSVPKQVNSHRLASNVCFEQYDILADNSGTSIVWCTGIFNDAVKERILQTPQVLVVRCVRHMYNCIEEKQQPDHQH